MSALAPVTPDLFSDTRMRLIRDTVARGAPEAEFAAMIEIAKVRGLDPLAKQISLIKFGSQWQTLTTIDGFRAIAERSGDYAGQDEPTHEWDGDRLVSTTVTVYKIVHGVRCPFTAKVYFKEYSSGANNWARMPVTMLTKVAESHALRKAFPSVLGGLYTRDEMDQAGPSVNYETGEIIDAPYVGQASENVPARVAEIRQKATATIDVESPPQKRDYSAIYAAGKAKGIKPEDVKQLLYAREKTDSLTKFTTEQLLRSVAYLNDTDAEDLQSDLAELAGGE